MSSLIAVERDEALKAATYEVGRVPSPVAPRRLTPLAADRRSDLLWACRCSLETREWQCESPDSCVSLRMQDRR